LFSILEPWELRLAYYRDAQPPYVAVYVKSTKDQEAHYKGLLGKGNISSPSYFVARFQLSDSCDFSGVGDAAAWRNWSLIHWQQA